MSHALQAGRVPSVALTSNGLPVGGADLLAPMRDSTDLIEQPVELRQRFHQDGYVLLRGVLDRDEVLNLRGDYFTRFDPVMFAPGTTRRDGVFSGTVPSDLAPYGTPGHPAHDFVRLPEFDHFTRNSALKRLAESLLGGPASLVPRRILRHFDSSSRKASRAHVDYDYMNKGTERLVTCWIPVGDCPVDTGGLVYLEGSHRVDPRSLDELRPVTDRPGDQRPVSHDLELTARTLGGRWLWADYAAGDVVVHAPRLVHASLDNQTERMRLSVDLRFHAIEASVDPRWNGDWSSDDGF